MRRATLLVLIVGCITLGVLPALAGVPFVVSEDFEGAEPEWTGTSTCFFDEAFTGEVVDDGTGNHAYYLTEWWPTEVYVSPTELSDFDLKFDVFLVPGDGGSVGLPGVIFRADPDKHTGYVMDWLNLSAATSGGEGGCDFTNIASAELDIEELAGSWHAMRVLVKGHKIKVFFDGEMVIKATDATYEAGHIGLAEINGGEILIDNLTLKTKIGAAQG